MMAVLDLTIMSTVALTHCAEFMRARPTAEQLRFSRVWGRTPSATDLLMECFQTSQLKQSCIHENNQQQHNSVIEFGIITFETFPKYSTIEFPSKVFKKLSQTLK
jgi:hypothetical protein